MPDSQREYWEQVHGDYVARMQELDRDRLVVSAVICAEGKVLLVRRAPDDTYPGMWEYPGGGVDEINHDFEHIVDALRREVLEETGIALPELPTSEVLVHETRTALRIVLKFDLDKIPSVTLSHEHDQFRFLDLEEAKKTQVDGVIIFDTMRDENRDVLSIVSKNSIGFER